MNEVSDPLGPARPHPRPCDDPWATKLEEIRDWLTYEGAFAPDVGALVEDLCEQILRAGIPLTRATTHIRALHSERMGVTRVWRVGQPIRELHFPHGSTLTDKYLKSPVKVVHDTADWVELWPDRTPEGDYGILPELKAAGVTHYLAGPLLFSSGEINAITLGTDRPGGFSPNQVDFLKALVPVVTPFFELRSLDRIVNEILRIYVGREPGSRILAGQIQRGAVTKIRSAMLFCDLRDFTALSARLSEEDLVALLNDCYDSIIPAVTENGGEILKFLGDGVLAIFAESEDGGDGDESAARRRACEAAYYATWDIQAAIAALNRDDGSRWRDLGVGIALHHGQAAYGNIGAGERLDFTVIGKDVNLTSRISRLSSFLERPVLMSEAFAQSLAQPTVQVGSFELKGIEGWQPVFAPA